MHIASGRNVWREDPATRNVWQYKGTQDYETGVVVARASKWQQGQEVDPNEEQETYFNQLYQQESMALGLDDIANGAKGKSFGKGKGKGFGKGNGSGKGKPTLLALKDKEDEDEDEGEEPTEEEEMKEALKRLEKSGTQ